MKFITAIAALASLAGTGAVVLAGDVDIQKNRDSHVTVWNTVLGYRYGDPVYDGTLPAGHKLKISEGWFTDLSVQQDLFAMNNHRATTGLAMVTGSPGSYTMPNLESAVTSLAGNNRIAVPDFASSFFDVFVTIDLDNYVMGGGFVPPLDSTLPVMGGHIPGMPGVSIGLTPFEFDPVNGWYTTTPFTGQVTAIGEMGLQSPAPGSVALLALGGAMLGRRRRR